jgi:hypothetical protein
MTVVKMTLKELRQRIVEGLNEGSVNLWNQHYFWNPKEDSVDDLVKGALKWYSFERSGMQLTSPADPKFLKRLYNRLGFLGVDDETREKVIFKMRLQKASSAEHKPVTATNLKPVK